MKKILLTLFVFASLLGTNNCSPKKKKAGALEQLVPLALLGGSTGDIANGSNSAGGGNNNSSGNTSPSLVEPPTFSPAAGHYTTPQNISISTTTSGADIYYTTDGSEPTTSSTPYTQPLHIWSIAGKTIKAIAVKTSFPNSSTLAGQFSYPPLKTGQTTSYVAGDDGATENGVARSYTGPTQHATYTSDYTRTDNATGLVWKTCSQGKSGATCATGTALTMNWQDAQTGTNGCNALNSTNSGNGYAGIKTWRLPSIQELETLPDYSKSNPSINATAFPSTVANYYWSSTTYASSTSNAWYIYFSNGGLTGLGSNKTNNNSVRCVSGSFKDTTLSFTDNGDGTVKDNTTGLIWQKCTLGQGATDCSGIETSTSWANAITYCSGLSLATRTWRLPNINELKTILDTTKSTIPTIDTAAFPATVAYNYWSSTTYPTISSQVWDIHFGNGVVSNGGTKDNSSYYRIRCVSGP